MAKTSVIIAAAGKSSRFQGKGQKKPFAPLDNRAVWLHSTERFLNRPDVGQVILVISPEDREAFMEKYAANVTILGVQVVDGGAERADSIERALARVEPTAEMVCVHDAARPCLADEWIDRVFQAASRTGAAILAVPINGTIKRVRSQEIAETVPREGLWEAQTPQVFRRSLLLEAYAKRAGFVATDDAQLVERLGKPVAVVPGSAMNLKLTTGEDLRLAEAILKALPRARGNKAAHPFADDDMWR